MRSSLVFALLASLLMPFLFCKKTAEYFLRDGSREDIKKHVIGKWKFKEQIIGISQERVYRPPGEVFEFKFDVSNPTLDSLFYYVNDSLYQKSDIVWNTYDDWTDNEGTLTVLSTSIIPFFCVGELKGDNLRLFSPGSDGDEFFLTRNH